MTEVHQILRVPRPRIRWIKRGSCAHPECTIPLREPNTIILTTPSRDMNTTSKILLRCSIWFPMSPSPRQSALRSQLPGGWLPRFTTRPSRQPEDSKFLDAVSGRVLRAEGAAGVARGAHGAADPGCFKKKGSLLSKVY